MAELKRVRDKATGHEYTTALYLEGAHELLDEPAVGGDGRALAPKFASPTPAEPQITDPNPDGKSESKSKPTNQGTAQGGSTSTGGN